MEEYRGGGMNGPVDLDMGQDKMEAELKAAGVDFFKVHDHTPRDVYFAIAQEAPRLGLTFAGHVPQGVTIAEAAEAMARALHPEAALILEPYRKRLGLAR